MENWTSAIVEAGGVHRIAVVALGIVPLLMISIAAVPVVAVLPFFGKSGTYRAERMVGQLITWNRALLAGSRRGR